jgi:dinuclear metal center YbgI/SA1388 family protein
MTTTVSDVACWLEQFAPSHLAESWDNVGLLWGDPADEVRSVMTCLTVTPESAAEAIREQASMIVSHHPVLFHAVKRIRADLAETGHLWKLARVGIAIASPHTAFDNAHDGINEILCRRLGLVALSPLRPLAIATNPSSAPSGSRSFKIVVFTPESDREAVMAGAFEAGAGQIGAYRECSFASAGEGSFFGTEESTPAVGEKGRREMVQEMRLEVVCPEDKLPGVLTSIRARHSYEEPAIDVYPLHEIPPTRANVAVTGSGRIGRLVEPRALAEFAAFASRALSRISVLMAGDPNRPVKRVAVSCGAGEDFLKDAVRAGADVLLTGEARFHRGIEAEALGIALITAGHYATERLGVEELARRIVIEFPALTVWPSRSERDPFRMIGAGTNEAAMPDTRTKL